MSKYIYTNCIGSFVFDQNLKLIDNIVFSDEKLLCEIETIEQKHKTESENRLVKKHNAIEPTETLLENIRSLFNRKEYFEAFYRNNLIICKSKMKQAFTADHLIIQSIKTIDDIDKTVNLLSKRLRDWYGIYNPELSEKVEDNEVFVKKVIENRRKESFGKDLDKKELEPILGLADEISNLLKRKQQIKDYIEKTMRSHCLNIFQITGVTIGARLFSLAGSLRRLATMPSTIIQLLGAEKALFKHITTRSKSPKYGVLIKHPIVQNAKTKGKAARALAAKISLAAKLDFFKGEKGKGKEMLKELEGTFR